MIGWSGRRKSLTILLFVFPTIAGILVFNIYPMILNTYTSFTNRNKFRPNPDCTLTLNRILVPTCWAVFADNAPKGLGKPYTLADPIYANYADLIGDLFTRSSVLALGTFVVCLAPLYGASRVDKRLDKQTDRKVASIWIWLAGILLGLILAAVLNISAAYQELMSTGAFFIVVFRTMLFVILRVPISFLIGLLLALILSNDYIKGRTAWRVMLFIPWAASSVAILTSLVWQFFFRQQGTINQVLEVLFGVPGKTWLQDPYTAFGIVVLVDVWYSYPFFMIAILGALSAIPNELYEAADVDGASWWKQLRSITLPLIRPAILPAAVLTSITAFQMFGTVWAITQGGPIQQVGVPGATEFVMIYAYKQIYQLNNFGLATAFAVLIFLFLYAVTIYSLRVTRITKGAYE